MLVRIEASGLCHTDIHAAHGDWPVKPHPPFVPGHEGIGIVERLGAGVTGRAVGDRVAIAWLGHACGDVPLLHQRLGDAVREPAEHRLLGRRRVRRVRRRATPLRRRRCPTASRPVDAAPLTCAGVTTYKAIKVARRAPGGDGSAIFGIGGLGHLALQYARIAGGVRRSPSTSRTTSSSWPTELGADHVVNAAPRDPVAAIQRARRRRRRGRAGRVAASRSTRRSARCAAAAGWSASRCPRTARCELPIFDTVLSGISVIGSIVGTRNDLADVFALHAAGRTRVIAVERKLDEVNESIDDVLAGRVPARSSSSSERCRPSLWCRRTGEGRRGRCAEADTR